MNGDVPKKRLIRVRRSPINSPSTGSPSTGGSGGSKGISLSMSSPSTGSPSTGGSSGLRGVSIRRSPIGGSGGNSMMEDPPHPPHPRRTPHSDHRNAAESASRPPFVGVTRVRRTQTAFSAPDGTPVNTWNGHTAESQGVPSNSSKQGSRRGGSGDRGGGRGSGGSGSGGNDKTGEVDEAGGAGEAGEAGRMVGGNTDPSPVRVGVHSAEPSRISPVFRDRRRGTQTRPGGRQPSPGQSTRLLE